MTDMHRAVALAPILSTPDPEPAEGIWSRIELFLEDGSSIVITVPGVVGGGMAGYTPATPDEQPSIVRVHQGKKYTAKLERMLGST